MQTQSRFKGLLAILVSLFFIWGLFYVSYLFTRSSNNTNLQYIPKDAEFAIRIDGKKLIKKSFSNVIFTSRDRVVLDKLIEYISKESKDGNVKKIGIDLLSEIGIFIQPIKEGKVIGVLVNLSSAKEFKANAARITKSTIAISKDDKVGLILSYLSPTEIISESELQKIADKLVNTTGNSPFESYPEDTQLIEIKTNSSIFGKGTITISEVDNEVKIASQLTSNKSIPTNTSYCLKPKGLHISCALIPDNYVAALETILPIANKKQLPKITSISWNYLGLNIQEGGSHNLGFFVQPLTDILIEFEKPFHLKKHLSYSENFEKWGIQTNGKELKIGNQNYFVDSLSPTTYFIGINSANLVKRNNPYLINIEGDIADLLKINGSESISTFVEMIFPAFTSSNEFFKTIESTSIKIAQKGNKISLNGSLKFKKNKYVYTECVRYILALKGY